MWPCLSYGYVEIQCLHSQNLNSDGDISIFTAYECARNCAVALHKYLYSL